MEPTSIAILLGLALVAFLAIKWAQFVFGMLGFLLALGGLAALLKMDELQGWLRGGDLRGLAPQMPTIAYGAMGVGAGLSLLSFLLKRVASLRVLMYGVGLLAIGGIGYAEFLYGPTIRLLFREGVIRAGGDTRQREYEGSRRQNLQALHQALIAEHDSEGVFPTADVWMDAISDRITTNDMSLAEADKKYADPALGLYVKGRYGFAMNEMASGKYSGDFTDPDSVVLLFTSSMTSRNAHGTPQKDLTDPPRGGANLGITVSGKIVSLGPDGSILPE